ncbi:TonB-dependent receptor [Pseudoalteromonas sp. bablab_jr011]|uniref:TonB-dependent receptor n=1 Tax=Pseudoalteromonas sp. bablab_jr011 TaxID=2755062 RepID=UPI0018F294DB|nr:TonB-dependent receptor [Pseudoalteromonas sp. bablab_jr011]
MLIKYWVLGLLLLSSGAWASQLSQYQVRFEQQSLEEAVNLFSRTVEQTILYDPNLIQGYKSGPVSGTFTARQLISRLLKETPLCASEINSGWVLSICPKQKKSQPSSVPVLKNTFVSQSSPIPEEIVVMGFRDSLKKASELKRLALISQDSILAEDIADFPDLNLADSLQRVSGVSITREAGEGRQISLRGLGPDFTKVTINGIEALGMTSSPMDARGAVSRTRAFDFNLFSAELFSQVDVQKSYVASMLEGGIGGNVALSTPLPFDLKKPVSIFSYRHGINSNNPQSDPRVSMMYSGLWNNWGGLILTTYSERNATEYGTNTTRWRQENKQYVGKLAHQQEYLDRLGLWYPRGHRYSLWNNNQKRLGVTAAFQFKPNSKFETAIHLLYNSLKNDLDEHHLAVKNNYRVANVIWEENNTENEVIYAEYPDASWRIENRKDFNESVFKQISIDTHYTVKNDLSLNLVIGANDSDYQQPKLNKVNIIADDLHIITDFRQDPFYGTSYSPNFDTTNPSKFKVKDLYFQENYVDTNVFNSKIELIYDVNHEVELQLGLTHSTLKNSGHDRVFSYYPTAESAEHGESGLLSSKNTQVFSQHPDLEWVEADIDEIQSYYGLNDLSLSSEYVIPSTNFNVEEKTNAFYAVLKSENNTDTYPINYQIGLRWFQTDLSSIGLSKGNLTQRDRSYVKWLPSFNVVWDFADEMLLRFGTSKNITRPSLSDLSYSANVSQASRAEGQIGNISIGNPELSPFESVNIDSSYEWYFNDQGLLSFSLFYKNINNFVIEQVDLIKYSELGLPPSLLQSGDSIDDLFMVSKPVNSDSSTIKGFEVSLIKDFDFLPSPFSNFGINANFTWADGKTLYRNVQGSGKNQFKTFAGLSKQSYNLTFYYESDDWEARISSAYRSNYILSVESGNTDQDESGYHATNYIDFSAKYKLSDQLELTFEGLNLTDERQELYSDSNDRAYNTTKSGRSFFLGFTLKLD